MIDTFGIREFGLEIKRGRLDGVVYHEIEAQIIRKLKSDKVLN